MPWKGERDAYKIWLSEIILQQTRVEQGREYYLRFVKRFKSVHQLAAADEAQVLKMWEGLGYYSRARNLHFTAKHISANLGGRFPDNYLEILRLKGIGPYTAAAIASFAFQQVCAVVDGNVVRVLSRYFGIKTGYTTANARTKLANLANELIDVRRPDLYNQAIMDFGATVCSPAAVSCSICVLRSKCYAHKYKLVEALPVPRSKPPLKNRFFVFVHIRHNGNTYVQKRSEKDIWRGLYQFPVVECSKAQWENRLSHTSKFLQKLKLEPASCKAVWMDIYTQMLSHQKIHASFLEVQLQSGSSALSYFEKTSSAKLKSLAFPGVIRQYMHAIE